MAFTCRHRSCYNLTGAVLQKGQNWEEHQNHPNCVSGTLPHVQNMPQDTGRLFSRSLHSFYVHQDNEPSCPDKEAREKNGSMWGVSEDHCDPEQAGTEAAELDTTVVTLR